MEDRERVAAQMRAVSEYVLASQPAIMRAWRQAVRNDPELSTAHTLSRSRFDDYIPALLRAFSRQLASWPGTGIIAAQAEEQQRGTEHGAHRWQEGYSLPEVAREWTHLHLTLLDTFEQYSEQAKPDVATMATVRRLLALLCGNGVSRSVTEYMRLMQAEAAGRVNDLESALEQLNQLQRQRAELWREAAHDLRNTVGVVSNASGILRRDDAPDAVRAKSLAALQTGVSSLGSMLNDLLSLARLEAGLEQRELATFDVGECINAVCEELREAATARSLFVRAEGPPSLIVDGDVEHIRSIASHLAINGLRYSDQGGVTLTWSPSQDGEMQLWTLSVEDSSVVGRRPAATPVVDELKPLESSRSVVQSNGKAQQSNSSMRSHSGRDYGEGIGLSIVKHLCELLDATLEFSQGANGGTFRVTFPRHYER